MSAEIVPVIMCGGAGTRLWPVSRESMPKQFVPLVGPDTDLPAGACAHRRPRAVRAPDRHHQRRFPLRRRRAAARARHRGRHRARAGAARFRPRGRGRGRARAERDPRRPGAGAGRRPRHPQARRVSARPAGRGRGRRARDGSSPSASSPPTRRPTTATSGRATGSTAQSVRAVEAFVEKPDAATAGELRGGPLPLEQRQFPVSRRDHAGRDRALRAGDGGGRQGGGRRAHRATSTSCGSPPSRSRARRRNRSTMR